MIDFQPGDSFIVEGIGDNRMVCYSIETLVRFLRAQQAGTSWTIKHIRDDLDISTPLLFPVAVLDAYRGRW